MHDFRALFVRILSTVNEVLRGCPSQHIVNIASDLSLWTICNFYYEMERFNAKERADNAESVAMRMDDQELLLGYAQLLMRDRDYKMRRWCGMLVFLRFYFNSDSQQSSGRRSCLQVRLEAAHRAVPHGELRGVHRRLLGHCVD